jgi:hypothetical protein
MKQLVSFPNAVIEYLITPASVLTVVEYETEETDQDTIAY